MSKPTQAMIDIADKLCLDMPDTEDYDEVADFIYLNKEDFYRN